MEKTTSLRVIGDSGGPERNSANKESRRKSKFNYSLGILAQFSRAVYALELANERKSRKVSEPPISQKSWRGASQNRRGGGT